MKNFTRILILTGGLIFFINSNSYAMVDVSAYAGFTRGNIENVDDFSAYHFAGKAHYNTSLAPLVEMGFGAYYEWSRIKPDFSDSKATELNRKALGLDFNLILTIPIINPYARLTYGIFDKVEGDKEYFKAWGLGAGLEIVILPFFRIFGEYMYDVTDHGNYVKLTSKTGNLGVKFNF